MNTAAKSSPVLDHLGELHRKYASLRDGQVATYIPELAKADPDWFGICLVTAGGVVYEVGDSRQEFTIQSISKPFVYGMALEDNGRSEVLKKVGVEPRGDALKVEDYNRLVDSHPRIKIAILENISLALCSRLRKANRELSVFDR